MEATPIPRPPIKRYKTKSLKPIANVQPTADTPKNKADKISTFLRPYLSLKTPAIATPLIQPTKAELTYQPVLIASK